MYKETVVVNLNKDKGLFSIFAVSIASLLSTHDNNPSCLAVLQIAKPYCLWPTIPYFSNTREYAKLRARVAMWINKLISTFRIWRQSICRNSGQLVYACRSDSVKCWWWDWKKKHQSEDNLPDPSSRASQRSVADLTKNTTTTLDRAQPVVGQKKQQKTLWLKFLLPRNEITESLNLRKRRNGQKFLKLLGTKVCRAWIYNLCYTYYDQEIVEKINQKREFSAFSIFFSKNAKHLCSLL